MTSQAQPPTEAVKTAQRSTVTAGIAIAASSPGGLEGRIAEVLKREPVVYDEDEDYLSVETANRLASLLVAELGLTEEAATIPVFIEDVPRKMVWRGMQEGPAMHAEFIAHARYATPWDGPDCPDCAIEPGIHDRRRAEVLAQTQAGRV